jgi:hypothetical protein
MRRNPLSFAAAFGLAAALSASLTTCWSVGDCTCLPTPARPERQGPLAGLELASYDDKGQSVEIPVKPESGTLEVTGDTVVISYLQSGTQHRVVYEVTGPLW